MYFSLESEGWEKYMLNAAGYLNEGVDDFFTWNIWVTNLERRVCRHFRGGMMRITKAAAWCTGVPVGEMNLAQMRTWDGSAIPASHPKVPEAQFRIFVRAFCWG